MRMHDLNPADAAQDPGHDPKGAEGLERDLLRLIEESREQAAEDPFRNPVLAVTLAITRRFDRGEIGEDDLDALFPRLRSQSLAARAERLRAYVGSGPGRGGGARQPDGRPPRGGGARAPG